MIVITGAAGFIGSCLVSQVLAEQEAAELVVVDDFSREDKRPNLAGKRIREAIHRDAFPEWLDRNGAQVRGVFHLGARTDTAEQDKALFDRMNVHYSQTIWNLCTRHGIPLIYASSAATYGNGDEGYTDDHAGISRLRPLNPYGDSKQAMDLWVLEQTQSPPFWAGIKFFNVYGPNEYHKGRMASVVWHAFQQIKSTGGMRLFRSHRPDIAHGEQQRDFVYIRDVIQVLWFLFQKQPASGIYNLGSGQARTFLDLTRATFVAMGLPPNIDFIDTPADIRDTYQYFTEANMSKLRGAGYNQPFTPLEEGVREYVQDFLVPGRYF